MKCKVKYFGQINKMIKVYNLKGKPEQAKLVKINREFAEVMLKNKKYLINKHCTILNEIKH